MQTEPHPLCTLHVASMSVKEVVQTLVDDDMVDSERIGTSTYFWAFPSKASMKVLRMPTASGQVYIIVT